MIFYELEKGNLYIDRESRMDCMKTLCVLAILMTTIFSIAQNDTGADDVARERVICWR